MDHDEKCEECGSRDLDKSDLDSRGEVVCNVCGLVALALSGWLLAGWLAPISE